MLNPTAFPLREDVFVKRSRRYDDETYGGSRRLFTFVPVLIGLNVKINHSTSFSNKYTEGSGHNSDLQPELELIGCLGPPGH